jgi:hypothetical protein
MSARCQLAFTLPDELSNVAENPGESARFSGLGAALGSADTDRGGPQGRESKRWRRRASRILRNPDRYFAPRATLLSG